MNNFNKYYPYYLIGFLSFLINLSFLSFGIYDFIESKFYNLKFQLRGPIYKTEDIKRDVEDPEVAEFMNENFINVKVDREERPDIDAVYMKALMALTGEGGWPLSLFLTPAGELFFGGTYWPLRPRKNQPGFFEILEKTH